MFADKLWKRFSLCNCNQWFDAFVTRHCYLQPGLPVFFSYMLEWTSNKQSVKEWLLCSYEQK